MAPSSETPLSFSPCYDLARMVFSSFPLLQLAMPLRFTEISAHAATLLAPARLGNCYTLYRMPKDVYAVLRAHRNNSWAQVHDIR